MDSRGKMTNPRLDVAVTMSAISKTYGGVHALRDVSFTLGAGEFVSIVGPSGCGKSTLLRLIAGLDVPDEGGVFADGTSIEGPSRRRGPPSRLRADR